MAILSSNMDNEVLRSMGRLFRRLQPIADEGRLPVRHLQRLRKKEEEFRAAIAECARMQDALQAASARQAEVRGDLLSEARRVEDLLTWKPTPPVLEIVESDAEEPAPVRKVRITQSPRLRLAASLGMVTVHWGTDVSGAGPNEVPEGVTGANIYRRRVGERKFELRGEAARSPYHDQVVGAAAEWEYAVEYVGAKGPGPRSEPSVVMARGVLAA